MKNRIVGAEFPHPDERADKHYEANSVFSQFCESAQWKPVTDLKLKLRYEENIITSIYGGFHPPHGATAPSGPGPPHHRGFKITFRHTTLGMIPLDKWSARRIDLYLTTHTTLTRETSMHSVGFETTIPASERPQTHALDREASGIYIYSSLANWNELNGRLCTTGQQAAEHHYSRCNPGDKADRKVKVYSHVTQAHNARLTTDN
jgi:hypothetical protein